MKRSNIWSILSSGILVMVVFFASVDFRVYQVHGHETYMEVIQLTNNEWNNYSPRIHDGQVTWYGYDDDGGDLEIFLYNGSSVTQITDNDFNDEYPQIHDGQVVWSAYDGGSGPIPDKEIFLYNGNDTIQVTANDLEDYNALIHDGQISWIARDSDDDGNDLEIYFYDGTSVTKLTNDNWDDHPHDNHDGQITWYGSDGSDLEIYLAKRVRTVIHYDPENPTIRSDANNNIDVLVVTSVASVLVSPGESYVLPEAAPQTFTLNLTAGWNMVSLPFLPDDPSAQSVMDGIGFFQLVTWIGTGYIDSTEFELGKGYWLLVLEDTSITITE